MMINFVNKENFQKRLDWLLDENTKDFQTLLNDEKKALEFDFLNVTHDNLDEMYGRRKQLTEIIQTFDDIFIIAKEISNGKGG